MKKIVLFIFLFIGYLYADAFKECLNKTLNKPFTHIPTLNEKLSITTFTCNYKGKLNINDLRALKNVVHIEIIGNIINAPIPEWIGELNKTEYLNLSGNDLRGRIPQSIGNLTKLKYLDLSVNNFTNDKEMNASDYNISSTKGTVDFVDDFSEMIALHPIPTSIKNLANLEELHLESSKITSIIPNALGNLTKLKKLYLQDNKFFGSIPKELGNLTSLKNLRLDWNNLKGKIPEELTSLQLIQPAGLNLKNNCRLETEDNTTINWINAKSSFYGGAVKMKSTGGHCNNPAMIPIILYLLGD